MADETDTPVTIEHEDYVTVRITHVNPAGVDLTFADAIAIQHTDTEFTITFSQVYQPLIFEPSEYDNLKTVEAKVVARIVLTPKKMAELIRGVEENWRVFQGRMLKLREKQAREAEAAAKEGGGE